MSDTIEKLVRTIKSRKGNNIKSSYTSFLLSKGDDYCLNKLKEEVAEIFLPWTSEITKAMSEEKEELSVIIRDKEFKHSIGGPQKYHVKSFAVLKKKYDSFKDNEALTNILSEANCLDFLI